MTDVDVDQARYNMLEQQVRPWDVLDPRVLSIMAEVPRERFVPERYRNLAFADLEIPMGYGQVMMSPKVEGRLLQALDIQPVERVLEIGTGTGYLAACMARMADEVVTVELYPELSRSAQQRLAGLGFENVHFRVGDAARGWDEDGSFDAIAVTGSLPILEESFKTRLKVGGRLFCIVGEDPVMEALLITRVAEDGWARESLFETVLPPLENVARPRHFEF